jgi:hypothetical protein
MLFRDGGLKMCWTKPQHPCRTYGYWIEVSSRKGRNKVVEECQSEVFRYIGQLSAVDQMDGLRYQADPGTTLFLSLT